VIAALCLPRPRNAARFLAGVAAGFLVPVLPFAVLAPARVYDSVVVAQLVRTGTRTPLDFRLQYLTGVTAWQPGIVALLVVAVAAAAVTAGTMIAAWRVTRQRPSPLEWFGVATAALVIVAFLVPVDFYYHYPAFLAPFLGLALALPASRLALAEGWANGLRRFAVPVAGAAILVLPVAVPGPDSSPTPTYASALTAVERVIPPGACVATDEMALLISADRTSSARGCPAVVDGTGTSYVLGQGRSAATARSVPAVTAVWQQAFRAARYVLLTPYNGNRIAWTPQLRAYLRDNFAAVSGNWAPLQLYARHGT
jgi:hypothetical protein